MNLRRTATLAILSMSVCVGAGCDPGTSTSGAAGGSPPDPPKTSAAPEGASESPPPGEPTDDGAPLEPSVVAWSDAPQFAAPVGPGGTVRKLATGNEAFVAYLELEPGAKVPEHQDETEEFIHVLEGGGTMVIDGEAHEVRSGTTVFMPAMAKVSFDNGSVPMRALQMFADPGPEKKYDAWAPVGAPKLRHQARCESLAEVYCPAVVVDDELDREDSIEFGQLSVPAQAAWHQSCRQKLDAFDDEQLKQFDGCVGCVASCGDALDCLAGIDLCDI